MISACSGSLGSVRGAGEVSKPAPTLAIQSLNGKGPIALNALSGKVTIVEFWATWCTQCVPSLTRLEELRKQSGGKVEVIGISIDDTPSGVAEFAKAHNLSFPIAWDENHTLKWRWDVADMPATYVLDGKGMVRFVHDSKKDDAEILAREVAQLTGDEHLGSPESAPKAPETMAAAPQIPVAAPVAVNEPTPAAPASEPVAAPANDTPAAAPSTSSPASKPRAKPRAAKKAVSKKSAK
jgi:peroxiredoxin